MAKFAKCLANTIPVSMVSTFPPDKDGIASYTARLRNALITQNVKVNVIANGKDWKRNSFTYVFSIFKKSFKPNVGVMHFQLSYFTFGSEYYTGLFPVVELALKMFRKRIVITLHDIVEHPNSDSAYIKSLSGNKLVNTKQKALQYYTKIVCALADRIIVHSEKARDTLLRDYNVSRGKISIIPHGIDQYADSKSKIDNASRKKVITYFGFVRKGKGLEELVRAWKKVKFLDAQLQIIGGSHPHIKDGYFEKLQKLVTDLNLQDSIHFCGYVPNEELPQYLGKSDAFVFPYNEWGEIIASSGALSIVAPYRKPIIASDVPAFAELKNRGGAIIVKRGNVDELASAIIEVLTNKETQRSLENGLCQWLPQSSWSNVAMKTEQLYRELC